MSFVMSGKGLEPHGCASLEPESSEQDPIIFSGKRKPRPMLVPGNRLFSFNVSAQKI